MRGRAILLLSAAFLVAASGLFTPSDAQGTPLDPMVAAASSCVNHQNAAATLAPVLTGVEATVAAVLAADSSHLNDTSAATPAAAGAQGAASTTSCCNLHLYSKADGTTRWTDIAGPGLTGYNQVPVLYGSGSVFDSAADRIWKQSQTSTNANADGEPANWGTEFTTVFVDCLCSCSTGTLTVLSDDQQRVFFNDVEITSRGVPSNGYICNAGWGGNGVCLMTYTVSGILAYPHPNTFRIHVKNQWDGGSANPAYLAYRFDW